MGMAGLSSSCSSSGWRSSRSSPIPVGSTRRSTTGGPRLGGPSLAYPLGTDRQGISVLSLIIEGSRTSLYIGLTAALISMLLGTTVGLVGRLQGRGDRLPPDAPDRRLPRPAVAGVRDRHGVDPRPEHLRDHPDHRDHVVGRNGATRASAGALGQGTQLHRTLAGAGLERLPSRDAPRAAQPHARHLRQHDPDDRDRDPVRVGPVVPRSGQPVVEVLGDHHRVRVRCRGVVAARLVVADGSEPVHRAVVLGFTMVGFAMDEIINPRIRER